MQHLRLGQSAFNPVLERFRQRAVQFEAGRRHYLFASGAAADTSSDIGAHSDYHFYSISALLAQPIGQHFKLKGTLDFQTEVHDNPADNNHIIFLSAELGYSFRLLGR